MLLKRRESYAGCDGCAIFESKLGYAIKIGDIPKPRETPKP